MTARDLPPELLARMLDEIVLYKVSVAVGPDALPDLEDQLIGLLEEVRQHGDPEPKPVAVGLIVNAIRRYDPICAELARQMQRGEAVAS